MAKYCVFLYFVETSHFRTDSLPYAFICSIFLHCSFTDLYPILILHGSPSTLSETKKSVMMRITLTLELLLLICALALTACGSSRSHAQPYMDNMDIEDVKALQVGSEEAKRGGINPQKGEAWVIEGRMQLSIEELKPTLVALNAHIKEHGEITKQEVKNGSYASASLTLRVRPEALSDLLVWLRALGDVEHEFVSREEVSRQLLAQDVTLKNAQTTLKRLKVFIDKDTLQVDEVLRVEREMGRLREQIDRVEQERELLRGRVGMATLHVGLSERPRRLPRGPEAKFYVAGRPTITLTGPDSPEVGWGVSIFNPFAPAHFHVDFDQLPQSKRTFLTLASSAYSEFFGDGENHFFNPHVGFKLGYASDAGHNFVFGGGLGMELLRFKYTFVNLRVEGLGLVGNEGLRWMTLGSLDLAVVY